MKNSPPRGQAILLPLRDPKDIVIMKMETEYMGIRLNSPVVVSACPLSDQIDNIVMMEDNGAGAVVLSSLFEENIRKEEARLKGVMANKFVFAEAMDFFPDLNEHNMSGPFEYLDKIRKAKSRVRIPIIASLNGITNDGWVEYAKLIEEAGADGIEVNIFFIPANVETSSDEVEQRYLNIIRTIKESVRIPIAVKINPYFSALGNMGLRMQDAGADALVLFNRFYQPDFDITEFVLKTDLNFSESSEIRLPLWWIGILYGKVSLSLAATTGVQSAVEVIKYLLAGADIVMTASSLYKYGIGHLRTINKGLEDWMVKTGFEEVRTFKGMMSQRRVYNPVADERANYIRILESRR
jgi:dihydroorotate dehydrogenase (fumarate)